MHTPVKQNRQPRADRTGATSDLVELARRIRLHVLRMVYDSGASHLGSSYSMAELLAALYGRVLRVDPLRPDWPERDRFILSKGHGCAGLYAVLSERGFFPQDWLRTFYSDGSRLPGHSTYGVPGIEVSTGSLGHGLPIAAGMALASKCSKVKFRVFALLSDGECDEGSTWEAAMFASHHRLASLTAIIDYNKLQGLGAVSDVLGLEPLGAKWKSFGWTVKEIDGHDPNAILDALEAPALSGQPACVIAHTIKGKGVTFMEGKALWHYRAPDLQEFQRAEKELERTV